jgi:hypothetical protein
MQLIMLERVALMASFHNFKERDERDKAHSATYFIPKFPSFLQTEENMGLFLRTNDNFRTILTR